MEIKEQEGRIFGLTEKGKNIISLLGSLKANVVSTLQAMGADGMFEGNKSFTDTYIQDIGKASIEELIQAKVIFKLEDNNPQENTIMESKENKIEKLKKQLEEATGKEVILQEATNVSSNSVGDVTVEEIIPVESAKILQDYVAATLKELKGKISELETIKFDVSPGASASAEDWKQKTENVQFSVKQLERVARFVNNTLVAKKFDKNILDKLVALTPAEDTADTLSTPSITEPMTPPMDDISTGDSIM